MRIRSIISLLVIFIFFGFFPQNSQAKKGIVEIDDKASPQEDDSTVEEEVDNGDDGISDIEIYINVATRRLYLYNGDELVMTKRVAVGTAAHPTPIGGEYPVLFSISNPDWTPPPSPWAAGSHYEPPGPKSATGIGKLYLRSPGVHIHGTPKDNSIGNFASHGCMRMHNTDVVELLEYILENVAHTKPGKLNDMSNEEYFEYVKNHPYTKFSAKMDEVVYVHTYYDRAEVIDGVLFIAKDGYYRGGDVLKMAEEALSDAGVNIAKVDWDYLAQQIKLNSKKDLEFDLEEISINHANERHDENMMAMDGGG